MLEREAPLVLKRTSVAQYKRKCNAEPSAGPWVSLSVFLHQHGYRIPHFYPAEYFPSCVDAPRAAAAPAG